MFTALLMLGVFFIGYFIVISSDQTLIRESEAAIRLDAKGLKEVRELAGPKALIDTLNHRLKAADNTTFYLLKDKNGSISLGNLSKWPTHVDEIRNDDLLVYAITPENIPPNLRSKRPMSEGYDLLSQEIVFDDGDTLLVGRNIDDLEIAQWVGQTFGWIVVFVLCLIAGASLWVGYYVVTRINAISDTAERIMNTGDLSARLPVESTWDDLSKLAVALNRMLDEIEQSVSNIKSVSDNIAHDLRTPLTRLRQRIEDQFDHEAALPLLNEADNLLSMFNGLLRIADIESDKQRSGFEYQDIGAITEDVIDLYLPLAEQKHIKCDTQIDNAQSYCDRDLIFQCIANVLDNAIKFTPEAGQISIRLQQQKIGIKIDVADSGIGIQETKYADITRRFYRADKSRTSKGNGLGMAMVAAIVKLHNGTINYCKDPLNKGSGLGVSIYLP
jgi:signal transduction histidine kinase